MNARTGRYDYTIGRSVENRVCVQKAAYRPVGRSDRRRRLMSSDTYHRRKTSGRMRILPAAVLITVMMAAFIVLSGFSHPQVQTVRPARCYRIITVHANDTLWDIAEANLSGQEQPIRKYIREIMDVNGLISSRIYPGQKLALPFNPELTVQPDEGSSSVLADAQYS